MTKDDVIRLARDSGMELYGLAKNRERFLYHLEAFAKLVAEHEREACAKVCDELDKSHWGCEVKATWCSQLIRARGQE